MDDMIIDEIANSADIELQDFYGGGSYYDYAYETCRRLYEDYGYRPEKETAKKIIRFLRAYMTSSLSKNMELLKLIAEEFGVEE